MLRPFDQRILLTRGDGWLEPGSAEKAAGNSTSIPPPVGNTLRLHDLTGQLPLRAPLLAAGIM